MGLDWRLVRCNCGRSFGHRKGTNVKCTRCGSSDATLISEFDDSRKLAKAVADSNMPNELAKEISTRLDSKTNNPVKSPQIQGSIRKRVAISLRKATDEQGIMRLPAIRRELASSGLDDESWESIIGGAELEGILVRCGNESWEWV